MEAARTDSAGLVPAPERSTQFFRESSRIGIQGSQLMNVARDVHIHQQPTAVVHSPSAGTPTTTANTQYTPGGCYCDQLLFQGRGFPLYVPAPRNNLPPEYARHGVSIGDVGRVTPEGVFDFFFNIYLPADHPINDNDVPDNFSPLTLYDSKSVLSLDYLPEDFVSTPDSVRKLDLPPKQEFEEFFFDGNGSQGAILAIPFGSHAEKLDSLEQMLEYARTNAESWYKYVNGARGRRLSNGSLYLITGWEKARAWGMASFQNAAAQPPFRLAFQPVFDGNTSTYKYRRTASGPARTRTSGQIPAEDVALNQTVFIHGFSISLGTGIWGKLFKGVEISQIVDFRVGQTNRDYVPYGSQGSTLSWTFGFLSGGGTTGGKQYGREDPASTDAVKISDFTPAQNFFHPSKVINNYMLQKFPDAAVVMSHDDDWRDILRADNTNEDAVSLLKRACEDFSLEEADGLITIRRARDKGADRDYQEDTQPQQLPGSQLQVFHSPNLTEYVSFSACICPPGPCICGGIRHTTTSKLDEYRQLEDLPLEMAASISAEALYDPTIHPSSVPDTNSHANIGSGTPTDEFESQTFSRSENSLDLSPDPVAWSPTQPSARPRKSRREKPRIELVPDQPPTMQGKPRVRVYDACAQCQTRKIRCDGAKPICHNCDKRANGSADCNYDPLLKHRGRPGARRKMNGDSSTRSRQAASSSQDYPPDDTCHEMTGWNPISDANNLTNDAINSSGS